MACNLCGSAHSRLLFDANLYDDGYPFDIMQCRSCGLVFRAFSLTSDFFLKQGSNLWSRRSSPDRYTARKIAAFEESLEIIAPFRKFNRILDVGSGQGLFLKICSDKSWQTWGVEIDPQFAQFARERYNLDVFNGRLEKSRHSEGFFDVATFFNVLEHLPDPFTTLKEAHRILRPGGFLLLRSTNAAFHVQCRRLLRFFLPKRDGMCRFSPCTIHLYSFDRTSISNYLLRTGFGQITIENSFPKKYHEKGDGNTLQRIIPHGARFFIAIIQILSKGRLLIAPSIRATAVK